MKVRVYASTANLGPGFDCLGAALNIYNEYTFYKADCFILNGFDKRYSYPDHNLIINSYKALFKKYNKEIIPIRVIQKVADIPTSRGLGSSAACIVAGLLMANQMLNNIASEDEIFQLASSIEGHPDNVAPVIFGGMTCSYKEDKYYTVNLKVDPSFVFHVVIPDFELSTSKARSVIKKEVSLEDATYNVSHSVATINALSTGNLELLKSSMKDRLHEPYRLPLIADSDLVIKIANENNAKCVISGAGSTMLVIALNDITNSLIEKLNKNWTIKRVNIVNEKSAVIKED